MSTPKNVLVDLWLAAGLATRLLEEGLSDSPLSVDEFALYGLIVDLGPVTATALGRWTGLPPTTLSALLRRCEGRSEVARTRHPVDRRSTLLELTPHGRDVYERSLPALVGALGRLRERLPQPEPVLRQALQSLDEALRAVLDADARPYALEAIDVTDGHTLDYAGPPLSVAQMAEAREFLEWIRHRDR